MYCRQTVRFTISTSKIANSELLKFYGIRKRFRVKLQKCTGKRARDDIVGNFLESLVTLMFRRLELKVQRYKTRGLDMMVTNTYKRKDVAVECTNWAETSWYNLPYFNNKTNKFSLGYSTDCGALWITSFKTNFPIRGNPQVKGIHFIDLKKQLLP
jgi:hypothetical protein